MGFDACPGLFPLHHSGPQSGQLAFSAFGCTGLCVLGSSGSASLSPFLPSLDAHRRLRGDGGGEHCIRHDLYMKSPENPGGNESLGARREEREREAVRMEKRN